MPKGRRILTNIPSNILLLDTLQAHPTFSLGALLSPIGVQDFFADVWQKRPLIVNRDAASAFSDLLSLDDVDRVLTTLNLRYPEIRLVTSKGAPKADDYTFSDSRIDAIAVSKLFANGVTIVLDQMQRRLVTLATLCRNMENELGITFQTNLYLTPPRGGGFKIHYDTHDVFILQVTGSKEWRLFESPVVLPMPGQYHDETGAVPGHETHRFTLHAGDIAYIPRGIYHQAHASDDISLHITLGAMVRTWCELMLEAVSELSLREVSFRRAVPLGFETGRFDHAQAEKEFCRLTRLMVESLNFEETANAFKREFSRTRHSVMRHQLLQMTEIKDLSADSIVVSRQEASDLIERFEDKLIVYQSNRTIEFPVHLEISLRAALSGCPMRVGDIDGDLDLSGKLALTRRLIEEGILRTIPV